MLFTALDFTSITSHIHNWVLFLLWLRLFILSVVIPPLFSSNILDTYRPEEFIFQCPIFLLFILFMRFSRQEYWSDLPFPFPVNHVLSEISLMTLLSWVALYSMAHSFTDLDKAVVHVISLISFLWLWFSFSLSFRMRIRGLWMLPDGRDWLWGKLGLVLMVGAIVSIFLIQFSVNEWSCVCSLLFDLRPNSGGGNEDNGDLLQQVLCTHCRTQCPHPSSRPMQTHTSTRDS